MWIIDKDDESCQRQTITTGASKLNRWPRATLHVIVVILHYTFSTNKPTVCMLQQHCRFCSFVSPDTINNMLLYHTSVVCLFFTCGLVKGISPTSSGTTPTSSGTTPTSSGTTPTSSGTTPTSSGASSTSSDTSPSNSSTFPTSSGASPTANSSSAGPSEGKCI